MNQKLEMSRAKQELWVLKNSICMNTEKLAKERKMREGGNCIVIE